MRDLRTIVILLMGLFVALCGLGFSIRCIFAPQSAIRSQARWSNLVTEESASDKVLVRQYRLMGAILGIGCIFFVLVILGKFVGWI
jgi:hypothetical protein